MADEPPTDTDDASSDEDVPDEYAMSAGERPEHIRRRNLITGLLLLLLIAIFVGISVYSRAVGW
jgi:hypothetical protein